MVQPFIRGNCAVCGKYFEDILAHEGSCGLSTEPWVSTLTPHQARRVGKTIEELGELLAVLGRLTIQNIDDIDPGTGKTNRQRMLEETADVLAQLFCNHEAFGIDIDSIERRVDVKIQMMAEWEAHFANPKD